MAELSRRESKPGALSARSGFFGDDFDRRFDEMLRRLGAPTFEAITRPAALSRPEWASFVPAGGGAPPQIDVYEKDGDVVVKAELPGVRREDIDLVVEDNALHIRAERRQEEESDESGEHRREIVYGRLERVVPLPAMVQEDKVDASFSEGVLTVRAPKAPEESERRRKIKVK